jgi:Ca2+/H+ antiporter
MTHFRMTTHTSHSWAAAASAGHPRKHARQGHPRHHAAASLPSGRIALLSTAVLIVVAAALVVALG